MMRPSVLAVHPVLMARDVAASTRYYQALGFSLLFQDRESEPRYAGVGRDGVELHLQWHDAAQFQGAGDRPAYRFLISDVDAFFGELEESIGRLRAGAPAGPWGAPGDTPWGTREFHLRDPGGNVLQFYQPA